MQFSHIVTALTFALAASAAPADMEARNMEIRTTPVNNCPVDQKTVCCSKATILPSLLGLNLQCLVVKLIAVGGDCGPTAQAACCASGNQNGAVNVGNICPTIKLL